MKKISYEQALKRLAAFCSKAERCKADIKKKLDYWEIPGQEQVLIIKELENNNFLNEDRYASAFINDKSKYNKWGAVKIRFELKKKGIAVSVIDRHLTSIDREENLERLRLLLINKQKTVKGKNPYEVRQKLIRFALGRGFTFEEIEKVLPE